MSDLEQEINQLKLKAFVLEQLRILYPDLRLYNDRWGHEYYRSDIATPDTDDCHIKRSCGCCVDPALQLVSWVNIDVAGNIIRVYTSVDKYVGEIDYSGCSYIDKNIEKELQEQGFPQTIIDYVTEYRKECEIDNAEILEEEYDDDDEE